jgi:archaetidylinositol phosphate synthase
MGIKQERKHKGNPRRANQGFLAPIESWALHELASHMPAWVTPNYLTALGFFGAVIVFFSYALVPSVPGLVWLATAGLAINWLGDSVDGTLARYRRIERPRFGFYLDNSLDVLEQLLIVLGLALSGIVKSDVALLGLVVFFMMSILTLIRDRVVGEFTLAYNGIGLTELRAMFAMINAMVFFFPPKPFILLRVSTTYPNVLAMVWITAALITFVVSMARDLRTLAVEDPPRRPTPEGSVN